MSNTAIIGNIKLAFNIPMETIKTVECRICGQQGDLYFCADHIDKNRKGHFEEYEHNAKRPKLTRDRAFIVVEKLSEKRGNE